MYHVLGEAICYQDGRPVLSLSYAPSGRKKEFLNKICSWMNEEESLKECNNFSALAHKESIIEEFDDESDFEKSKKEYMNMYFQEFRESSKL